MIGVSGKAGLRRRQPSVSEMSASRSSLPASTSRITPNATWSLLIDAMRTGSFIESGRRAAGSAIPEAPEAVTPWASNVAQAQLAAGGGAGATGTVAQAASSGSRARA